MYRANTTLIFLASCLAFAEAALVAIAQLTDVDPALVAVFALAALGMVVAALVIMYWRDPTFLTLSGEQAHDLRRLETLLQRLPEQAAPILANYLGSSYLRQVGDSRVMGGRQVSPVEEDDLTGDE